MAKSFSNILAISALLYGFQSKVLRIELEKQYLTSYDNVQLEDQTDIDLMIDTPIGVDDNLLIDSDEMNYSQLREI
jgi:hypothetical protein